MSERAAPALSLIVFAYNEAENVAPILAELCAWLDAHIPEAEIVFVDDGSSDDTAARARTALAGRDAQVLSHPKNRGIGAALKTGVAAARGTWATFMPADGQIEPTAIGTLWQAAADGTVDVVFSIYDDRNDGLDRKLLSLGVRTLITLVHQVRVHSDGPYLFRRSLFDPEQLEPDSFFLNFEFPIRVARARLPQRTVTIHCRARRAGVSKSRSLRQIKIVARDLLALRLRNARRSEVRAR